jgi:RNA polymerase sigma-70 factor, ECF subfamily
VCSGIIRWRGPADCAVKCPMPRENVAAGELRFYLRAARVLDSGVASYKPTASGTPEPRLRLVLPATDQASDDALCRAFLSGDSQAFGELVRRHQEVVFKLVRRYCDEPDDARDLAQRAFLQAFQAARRSLPRLGAGGIPFKAWLLRIAVNLGKNHARGRRRWLSVPMTDAGELKIDHGGPEALEQAERARLARAAVLELPRRQREVLTLRVDGELPFAEVAQVLGIEVGNAKACFCHAVKRLKAVLKEVEDP